MQEEKDYEELDSIEMQIKECDLFFLRVPIVDGFGLIADYIWKTIHPPRERSDLGYIPIQYSFN